MKLENEKLWMAAKLLLVLNIFKFLGELIFSEFEPLNTIGIVLLVPLIISSLIIYVRKEREYREVVEIEENFHKFLRDLSQEMEAGESLPDAIDATSQSDYDALTDEIKRVHAHISWGIPVNEALHKMGERSGSPHIRSALSIVLDAAESGGKIIEGLDDTADYSERLYEIRRKRKRSTRTYIIIFYIAFIIFVGIVAVLVNSLLPALLNTEVQNQAAGAGFQIEEITNVLFYMTLMQGGFSGAVAGKISEGSVIAGIKHSIAMITIAIIAFQFFVF